MFLAKCTDIPTVYILPGIKISIPYKYHHYYRVLQTLGSGICLSLYCENEFGECVTQNNAAADGTSCGDGMWCYQGECVPVNTIHETTDQNCNGKTYHLNKMYIR